MCMIRFLLLSAAVIVTGFDWSIVFSFTKIYLFNWVDSGLSFGFDHDTGVVVVDMSFALMDFCCVFVVQSNFACSCSLPQILLSSGF